jgi:hypothetical protein
MEDKEISQQESFRLIEQMISTAKQEQKDDGKGWIIWGCMLFLASLFTLLNLRFRWLDNLFIFWDLFGLVAIALGVVETVRYFFFKNKVRVKTYTKDIHQKLNIGFFISLMLIILSMNIGEHVIVGVIPEGHRLNFAVPPTKGFALLLGLYGFWILIYGTLLNFKPSIIGAYITWAFAIASLFVRDFQLTMLFHAAAVLFGYIIPGHLANREFNKHIIR